MNQNYKKTQWVDGKTPIDAEKLNNIENAISNLFSQTLSASDIKGDNSTVKVTTDDEDGDMKVKISILPLFKTVSVEELETTILDNDKLYFITQIDEESGENKIVKIILGGNEYVLG